MKKYYNKLCKCGCENKILVQKHHHQYGIPDYKKGHSERGKKPWNIGLTKETDERIKKYAENQKKTINSKEWKSVHGKSKWEKISKSNKGRKAWNIGLTKENNKSILKQSKKIKGRKRPEFSGDNNPSKRLEVRKKIGKANSNPSEETRKKKRIAMLNRIKKNGKQTIGKHETYILDKLEKLYGYKIIRQYHIRNLGYIVDGYIPELNLVIEVDEKGHFDYNGKLKEKDIIRQKRIEQKLNCKFLRIKDRF